MDTSVKLQGTSRRGFLAGSAGLIIGVTLPRKALAQAKTELFAPNAFIRIAPDNSVTVLMKHIEFGQGAHTGLTTLLAEELDASWDQMKVEPAPANAKLYKNNLIGIQSTGGSTAMANSFMQMRKAGATARAMLVGAAAEKWGVKPGEITVDNGILSHKVSGKSGNFGDFAEKAALQTPPADPKLKSKSEFKYIGKSFPKVDTAGKSNGTAKFTLDIYRENMLTAVVAHSPVFGGKVKSFDAAETLKVKGVVDVKAVPAGVAVYAENTFAALKGRDLLEVEWDLSSAETRSSDELWAHFDQEIDGEPIFVKSEGDVDAKLAKADDVYEAEYRFPFLAHAPMEPLDAVLEQKDGKVEMWSGSQGVTSDHTAISKVLGVDPQNVKLNMMMAGGSFGRRAQQGANFAVEAAQVFDASGRERPVKYMWTREDDIRGGFYRPMVVHRVRASMDSSGKLLAWDHRIAAQSLVIGSALEFMLKGGPDFTIAEGVQDFYYKTDNVRVGVRAVETGVPVLWWRSVGHTHTAFAAECFIDELFEKNNIDPLKGRLALLSERPRDKAVLERVAKMADWGRNPREGAAFGVAVHKSFGTFVAQIAEVSLQDGEPKVHKVWAAVDCGLAINPDVVKAQIEGGIGYGLGGNLFNEITLGDGGEVEQSNFHDYRSLRMADMPEIVVEILDSDKPPTGIGEPGTPPIAPAVANALRRLNGKPLRRLPIVSA